MSRLGKPEAARWLRVLVLSGLACACGAQEDLEKAPDGDSCVVVDPNCPAAEPLCIPPEYAADCSSALCADLYECVHYDDPNAGPRDVCLSSCDEACDCPEPCLCKGVNGNASWGPDGYCICV